MARQPIKYWETKVTAAKSASEVLDLLVRYKAERTTIEWDGAGNPLAVAFAIRDAQAGVIPVRLVARTADVKAALRKMGKYPKDEDHVRRIAWRHLRDLIEQQLLSVHLGMSSLVETFFANVQVGQGAGVSTLGEWVSVALQSGQVPRDIGGALMLPPAQRADD